jgi:hypothetical protein
MHRIGLVLASEKRQDVPVTRWLDAISPLPRVRCRVSPDRCAWAQCLRCYRGVRPRVVLSPVPNLFWVQPKPRPLC